VISSGLPIPRLVGVVAPLIMSPFSTGLGKSRLYSGSLHVSPVYRQRKHETSILFHANVVRASHHICVCDGKLHPKWVPLQPASVAALEDWIVFALC
jgi:hypothetical protein